MPWTAADARGHTRKAVGGSLARLWSEVANRRLAKSGDEASAVRLGD